MLAVLRGVHAAKPTRQRATTSLSCAKLCPVRCNQQNHQRTRAVGACAAAGMTAIVQSPADRKQYRLVTLENGLQCLLIHDPEVASSLEADPQVHMHGRRSHGRRSGIGCFPDQWRRMSCTSSPASELPHIYIAGNGRR